MDQASAAHYAGGNKTSIGAVYGYLAAQSLVAVLKQSGVRHFLCIQINLDWGTAAVMIYALAPSL
jgi:hypothetical protein